MDIAALGYEIDSSQAVQAAKDLDLMAARAQLAERVARRLSNAANGSINGIGGMGAAANVAGNGANRMANNITNASFQIQDFAVQVASGQSALMAFAQQFPQLAGSMGFAGKAGFYGAVIGTAAAVGVALYTALTDTSQAADAFKKQMDALEESVSSFRSAAELAASPLDKLYEKFGTASPVLQQALVDLANIEKVKAYDAINATAQSMASMVGYIGQWNAAANEANQYFLGFETNSEAARIAAFNFHQEMMNLSTAADPLEKLQAAINLRDQLDAATGGYQNMNSEQRTMREGLSKMIIQLQTMTGGAIQVGKEAVRVNTEFRTMDDLINSAVGAANSLSGAVGGIAGAAQRAGASIATMAQRLWDAAQAKATFNGVDAGGLAAQYAMYGQGRVTGERLSRESGSLYGGGSVLGGGGGRSGGGGGGGGGQQDQYANNLQSLIESLQTEQETIDAWYQSSLAILEDRRAQEILGEQAHKDALLALEKEYLERKQGLNDGYGQFSLESAERLFGEMYSLTGSSLSGLLKLQKTFGAAQALVNTYTAASQVLAEPGLSFFAKFAAVAKTIAAGMGLVNAIKGGGSGGAGAASGTTSATSSATNEPQRVTRVELVGDDWLVKMAESMMTQIYDASRDGRVIVARG